MVVDPGISQTTDSVARLVIEYWKLVRACGKTSDSLPDREARRFAAQVKYSELQLSTIVAHMGIRIVDFEGLPFTLGMAASADNHSDFDGAESLTVVQTIEPAILMDDKILATGRVLVGPPQEVGN